MDKLFLTLLTRLLEQKEVNDPKRKGVTRKMLPKFDFELKVGNSFPLLYSKRSFIESAIKEFNFFINNKSNIVDLGASFWDTDAYNYYLRLQKEHGTGLLNFNQFKFNLGKYSNGIPNYRYGDLGEIYGSLWKDQVNYVLKQLKQSNFNTDMLVLSSDYRNKDYPNMRALAACHFAWQIVGTGKDTIGIIFYMRSSDAFLGLPMNVLFYYILGQYIAYKSGLKLDRIYGNLANVHLYSNTFEEAKKLVDDNLLHDAPRVPLSSLEFIEKNDNIQAVFSMGVEYQEYKAVVPKVSVPMLGQSNDLLT